MNAVGIHLVVEFENCNSQTLNDLQGLKSALIGAAQQVGATVIGECFHQFSPHGVTGVVAIAESHLCIHTWPEHAYAAADIFTCGDSLDPYGAVDLIAAFLECADPQIVKLNRGPRTQPTAVAVESAARA